MTATTTVDHGIIITEVHAPAGRPLQASCLCGWLSPVVPSRPRAGREGQDHLAAAARTDTDAAVDHELREHGIQWNDGVEMSTATDTGIEIKPLAIWQTEPCPAWCDERHFDSDPPLERRHLGYIGEAPHRTRRDVTSDALPPGCELYLECGADSTQVTLRLFNRADGVSEFDLRITAAVELAELLCVGVKMADPAIDAAVDALRAAACDCGKKG